MKKNTLLFLQLMLWLFSLHAIAQGYVPVQLSSGFNSDVVANGIGSAITSTTHRVDSDNFNFLSRDFKAHANSPNATVGLPINGLITAANISGLTFQMQSYSANNSLRITALNGSDTLSLSTAVKMQKMYLLATAGSAGSSPAVLSATVVFADGTSQTVGGLTVADWFEGNNADIVTSGLGRVNVTNNFIETPAGDPKLFSVQIPLNVLNYNKEVVAVVIKKTANSDAVLNIFAVSALRTPDCMQPLSVSVQYVTATTAAVGWTDINVLSGLGCEYELRTSGAPGSGTVGLVETGTVPASIFTKDFINLVASTNYLLYLRYKCSASSMSIWTDGTKVRTSCVFPSYTLAASTVCGQNSSTLTATVSDTTYSVYWYDRERGGNIVGKGDTISSAVLTTTSQFWASLASATSIYGQGGRMQPSGINHRSANENYGIVFNTLRDIRLKSVDVYPTSSGTLNIKIVNASGQEIYSTSNLNITANPINGVVTIPLDMEIAVGDGYRLLLKASSGLQLLYDNDVVSEYPFQESNGIVSVPYASRGNNTVNYYFYFYNLQFEDGCVSARQQVVADVIPAPSLSLSTDLLILCEGQGSGLVTVVDGGSDYDAYSWSPSTAVSGDAVNGWSFDNTVGQQYTLTAWQTTGQQCRSSVNLTVGVVPAFEPTYIPSSNQLTSCLSETVSLQVVDSPPVMGQIGTDKPSYFSQNLSAFNNFRRSARVQLLFTAQELRNSGLSRGLITSLAFDINTKGASDLNENYTVKIATSSLTHFETSPFIEDGFTTVFFPKQYKHTASGWQQILFDTHYAWDGFSNLIIEITHTGIDSSDSANTNYTVTNDYTVMYSFNDGNVNYSQNRFNIQLKQLFSLQVSWNADVGNLFLDADASIPYLADSFSSKVYYKSQQIGSSTVTANVILDGCAKTKVYTLNTIEVAPVQIDDAFIFCAQTLISEVTAVGQNLKWYRSADKSTPVPDTAILEVGEYFVTQNIDGCESVPKRFTVDLWTQPNPPVYSAKTYCGTFYLEDMEVVYDSDNTLNWYDSNNNLIDSNVLMTTGRYYVSQTNQHCESSRVALDFVVNPIPVTPSFDPLTICGTPTVADLNPQLLPNALAHWYLELDSSTALAPTQLLSTRTYYLSQSLSGCESSRIAVAITVFPEITNPQVADQTFCSVNARVADLIVNTSPDATAIWYTSAQGGTILTPDQLLQTGYYYVSQKRDDCESERVPIYVTVGQTPIAPVMTAVHVCGSAILANLTPQILPGAIVNWYLELDSAFPLNNHTVLNTRTYYLSQTLLGCESERIPVVVSVFPTVAVPVAANQRYCNTEVRVADLEVTLVPEAVALWYTSMQGGTALDSNQVLQSGTYYVSQKLADCESARVSVVVLVIDNTVAPQIAAQQFCGTATVSQLYSDLPGGQTAKWYLDAIGGFALDDATILQTGLYYASQSVLDCESPRAAVQITVHVKPLAPTGSDLQKFVNSATVADLATDQTDVIWFASLADAQMNKDRLDVNLPLVDGNIYYGVRFNTDFCWSDALAVKVEITLGTNSFDRAELNYFPNPVRDVLHVSYRETITKVEVYSLNGQLLISEKTAENKVLIDISHLAQATYIVKLFTDEASQSFKIVKQ